MSYKEIVKELTSHRDKTRAMHSSRYFKTGTGEYGHGDIFLGLTVPQQRKISRSYLQLSLDEIERLLNSTIHEYRYTALLVLVAQYEKGNRKIQQDIFDFYLSHTARINNWDLVDTSASYIVGHFLFTRDRSLLYRLIQSPSLWERRIAIVATQYFIHHGDVDESYALAALLFVDSHDLIHKAVGWTLREAGKKDRKKLEQFLKTHYARIPRTTLRYAIEKFDEKTRKRFLLGTV
jgi:3-methyladenine DNA glycosylase AlkD